MQAKYEQQATLNNQILMELNVGEKLAPHKWEATWLKLMI